MKVDAVRGHVEAMVLAVLEGGPLHGYAVTEAVYRASGGQVELPGGTVYPALHRLERMGLLTSAWAETSGRRRRTYALTRAGRQRLEGERSSWRAFTASVGAVIDSRP